MKKLLLSIVSILMIAALVWPQSKIGGTGKVGGVSASGYATAVVVSGRALILNGTNQNAHVTLPIGAPFSALGAFQIIFRLRDPVNDSGFVFQVRNSAEAPLFDLTLNTGGVQWVFNDYRDSVQIFLTPTTITDSIYKLQYDPANSRWTFESWDSDGTDRVVATGAITTTTAWDLSLFTIGSNFYDNFFLAGKLDWFRWSDTVEALNSGCPAASAPLDVPTYYARWEFEDNNIDCGTLAGDFLLAGSPTYGDSPAQTCP